MSAAAQTRVFGVRVDRRTQVGGLIGLIVLAALLFWYNSRSEEGPSTPAATARPETTTAPAPLPRTRASAVRRVTTPNDRGTLRLRTIDPTRGDVDPTLRLDLLQKLQTLQAAGSGRSLFEVGSAPQMATNLTPINGPKIPVPVGPQPLPVPVNTAPVANIPLKYYGFVKPLGRGETNRGFFLDGENVVIALEGQVVDNRYLVVALTPSTARLEDTQLKQGQTLNVVPEATVQ